MKNETALGAEPMVWVEPTVEALEIRATEANWGVAGNDGFAGNDSAS